ncbi:hypothetical protein ACHHYP_07236 [Achlya hypogyna]|uniref:Protein phosphatase inhibitor 2 n=1 Tax=Achlya hypogyna TaxID=1202772 RepID=A0A1V9ZMA1_ACHHY|nr:hypothetical protein ACHHYP_07236 [Achlya hypogyna]
MTEAGKSKPRIQWDEATIALHDLDRGTRMKINEPNTPYHYYEGEEDHGSGAPVAITDIAMQLHDADPANALQAKHHTPASPARSASNGSELKWDELEKKLKVQEKKSDWDSGNSSGEDDVPKSAKKDFSKKRKQHYNEFEMMKQWRLQHQKDDEEE